MASSRNTRSSRNRKRSAPSVNEREVDGNINVNAGEADIEASGGAATQTGAAATQTETESPTGGSSAIKIRQPKKKTSAIWNHFLETFVQETVDDMVINNAMAACKYCDDVLPAPSRQGTTRLWNHYYSYHDDAKEKCSIKKANSDSWMYEENSSIRKYYLAIIMHEYPLKFCEHEYTNDFIRSLRPDFPISGRKGSRTRIMEWLKSNDSFVVTMAKSMKEKFDKYWEMSNVALAVACFLDPRYKMKVVEFYYSEMSDDYGFDDMYEFKKIVQKLYDSYASKYGSNATSFERETVHSARTASARTSRTSQCYVDLNEEPKRKRLSSFLRDNAEPGQEQTDLDQYINEPLLSWKEGDYFDILSWWKTHSTKYPILSRLARDVLAIPASTVASESAFSAGGRVVHKYRSRLDPQVVEALICTKDWIKASREDQYNVSSIIDDLADLTTNDTVEQDEAVGDVGRDAADLIVEPVEI